MVLFLFSGHLILGSSSGSGSGSGLVDDNSNQLASNYCSVNREVEKEERQFNALGLAPFSHFAMLLCLQSGCS